MVASKRGVDRRIERTRQVLFQAFKEVAREKGFAATSIQDIAERANVNRGTFYHHFTDKYMLVDVMIREQFQQQVARTLPPSPHWSRKNLSLLIQTVLYSFEGKYQHQRHLLNDLAPLLERAIYEEMVALLSTWLKQAKYEKQGAVSLETLVRVVGWAIFGSAIEWSQEENARPLEQMADEILQVIMAGMAQLTPVAWPE